MINVYLVGVDHRIQWIPDSPSLEWEIVILDFIKFINEKCNLLGIDLIAEEFSEHVIELNHAQDSTARHTAREIGIPHLFSDPNPHERQELGIKNNADREKEWLRRIINSGNSRILFICGDDHLESFKSLLNSAGHNAEILASNWGKGWELIN